MALYKPWLNTTGISYSVKRFLTIDTYYKYKEVTELYDHYHTDPFTVQFEVVIYYMA